LQIEIFEKTAEHTYLDPTFVYAYPAEVSPLSRANDAILSSRTVLSFSSRGSELGDGFSELNDAEDQAARFKAQVARKEKGDDEGDVLRRGLRACVLEYGMPPTAGLGVGIDRLVMFFTTRLQSADVILFPHMKPERVGKVEGRGWA